MLILAAAIVWFGTPHVFLLMYPRRLARLGLALVWMASGSVGAGLLTAAHFVRVDMDAVHYYPLSDNPGSHRVEITRLSRGFMEGWVHAKTKPPAGEELRKIRWSLPQGVSVDWFEQPTAYWESRDQRPPLSVFLFHVKDPGDKKKLAFEYACPKEQAGLLNSCSLLVRHDYQAIAMLSARQSTLSLFGGALLGWGIVWLLTHWVLVIDIRSEKVASTSPTPVC